MIKCGFQQDFETQKVRKGVYIICLSIRSWNKFVSLSRNKLIIVFTLIESNLTGREISKFSALCLLLILHRLEITINPRDDRIDSNWAIRRPRPDENSKPEEGRKENSVTMERWEKYFDVTVRVYTRGRNRGEQRYPPLTDLQYDSWHRCPIHLSCKSKLPRIGALVCTVTRTNIHVKKTIGER